jgi:hypothetical protein
VTKSEYEQKQLLERLRLQREAVLVERWIEKAYKLDDKIAEDFWKRPMEQLRASPNSNGDQIDLKEPSTESLLNVGRTFDLAQKAHSMYVSQNPGEQAELLN